MIKNIIGVFSILVVASGCSVTPIKGFVSEGLPLNPIKRLILLKPTGFYPDVSDSVVKEFQKNGVEIVAQEDFSSDSQFKSDKADSIMWLTAIKVWGIGLQIRMMELRLYDAKTGKLLGTAKWEGGSTDTDQVVHELLGLIFNRTKSAG